MILSPVEKLGNRQSGQVEIPLVRETRGRRKDGLINVLYRWVMDQGI